MTGADDLDRALHAALGDAPAVEPAPAVRQALPGRIGQRRARRRRALASAAGAVVLLAAGGVAAYGLSAPGRPVHAAAGRSAQAPAPVRRPSGAGAGRAPAGAPAGAPPATLTALSCAQVRAGGTPAACAGSYARPSSYGADVPDRTGAAASARVPAAAGASTATGTAAPEELRVGQSVTVSLPAAAGLVWEVPSVDGSTAAGTGPPSHGAVVRLVTSGTGRPAGAASATFVAARQGVATLRAEARPACKTSATGCGAAQVVWSLPVTVEGS